MECEDCIYLKKGRCTFDKKDRLPPCVERRMIEQYDLSYNDLYEED